MSGDEIRVHVIANSHYPCYRLKWKDPGTGRWVYKSSGVRRTAGRKARKEAEKVAGALQADLNAGRVVVSKGITWADFRNRYQTAVASGLAVNTQAKIEAVFNVLEAILPPLKTERLGWLTAERIVTWQAKMREAGKSEATIAGHCSHVKAALNWAADVDLVSSAPKFKRVRRARETRSDTPIRGRAITAEEYERMVAAAPGVVGERAAPSWQHLLTGLWWGGLRIGEALNLWWEPRPQALVVDLSGKYPMIRVSGDAQKSGKDQLLPIAPEFAEFLLATPEGGRKGRGFRPEGRQGNPVVLDTVIETIMAIGRKAGVKVSTEGRVKYASAHDFRRAFGTRWAALVMPQILQQLMRHNDIRTTLRYYVGRNATATADVVWEAYRNQGSKGATRGATARQDPLGRGEEGLEAVSLNHWNNGGCEQSPAEVATGER